MLINLGILPRITMSENGEPKEENQSVHNELLAITQTETGYLNVIQSPKVFADALRYQRDFEELRLIGYGAFGQVFKVRHRLDEQEYAIKKIPVRSDRTENLSHHLDEVRTLAKLNHINIVAYKGAWIERSCSTSTVVEESDSDGVSFRNDDGIDSHNELQNSSEENDYSESFEDDVSHNRQICQFNSQSRVATLYIHMELCDQTLRQWMDERIEPTPETTVGSILTQILTGLQYIHSQGAVHHDIKPSNIFITMNNMSQLHVQLGDFGFACIFRGSNLQPIKNHHPKSGTQFYAAPEQLNGICDPKSDVYSLGVILFELLILMKTRTERICVFDKFKTGIIPECLAVYQRKWTEMIQRLVNIKPQMRPSTTELLNALSDDKDLRIAQLTTDLQRKDSIIRYLEEELCKFECQS